MSLGGNGSAWAVIGGVIAVGLCAGLGTAGFLVSAMDFSDLRLPGSDLPQDVAPAVDKVVEAGPTEPVVQALSLPEGARTDPRVLFMEGALNQGILADRAFSDIQLRISCESDLSWACSIPQHLGEVDRDLVEQSCQADEAVSCVVLGWLLTQRDERGLPTAGRTDLQWMGVGSDLVDTTRDLKGADAFEQACRLGEPRGCGELGRSYGWGVGRAFELSEAQTLFELACGAGDSRSCVWLGDAHEAKDEIELAKAQYQKACDEGVGEGCRARSPYEEDPTALLSRGCDELKDGRACIWQAENQVNAGEAEGVLRLEGYCALPSLGLPFACDLAAGFYLNPGHPVTQDEVHAVNLNRTGCSAGDPASCAHLAYRYQDGRGEVVDIDQAKLFLEKACTQNYAEACLELAELRFGTEEYETYPLSASAALEAMEKGCALENGEACNRLGIVLSKGQDGVAKDSSRVEGLYRRACELDWAWGCFNEAWWSDAGDAGEAPWAAKKFKKSCEMGLARGCDAYADRLLTGRGVAYDPKAGEEFKAKACELGEQEACD